MKEWLACDVSEYQGVIDFARLKSHADAVILRLGYVGNSECCLDEMWARNVAECEKHEIPWGVYVYTYVKTPERMRTCADWVVRQLAGHRPTLPVYLDIEESGVVSGGNANTLAMAKAFCGALASAGFAPGIYSSTWWYETYLNDPWYDTVSLWVADWSSECGRQGADLWQYTSRGRLPGIDGYVDLNRLYLSPVPGDADGDGAVTARDARLALRASARLETLSPAEKARLDADGDGVLTARDARRILRRSAGLEEDA